VHNVYAYRIPKWKAFFEVIEGMRPFLFVAFFFNFFQQKVLQALDTQ